jgi:hypothetical protein
MAYMVALEDGEIVKRTAKGFETTGMFIMTIDNTPMTLEAARRHARLMANA